MRSNFNFGYGPARQLCDLGNSHIFRIEQDEHEPVFSAQARQQLVREIARDGCPFGIAARACGAQLRVQPLGLIISNIADRAFGPTLRAAQPVIAGVDCNAREPCSESGSARGRIIVEREIDLSEYILNDFFETLLNDLFLV